MCRPRVGEANPLFSVCIALWRPTALAKIYNAVGRQRNLGLYDKWQVMMGGKKQISTFYHKFNSEGVDNLFIQPNLELSPLWNVHLKNIGKSVCYELYALKENKL